MCVVNETVHLLYGFQLKPFYQHDFKKLSKNYLPIDWFKIASSKI